MFETARVGSKTIQGEIELKERKLGITFPYGFRGKLLVAFEERWKDFFKGDPTFEILLDKNNRLTLRGPVVQSSQRDPTVAQEETT